MQAVIRVKYNSLVSGPAYNGLFLEVSTALDSLICRFQATQRLGPPKEDPPTSESLMCEFSQVRAGKQSRRTAKAGPFDHTLR